MMFDMKSARDVNTTSVWSSSIWRLFIGDKLFVGADNKTCFDSEYDARKAFFASEFWKRIQEYVDYSQEFFDKQDDVDWRKTFENNMCLMEEGNT